MHISDYNFIWLKCMHISDYNFIWPKGVHLSDYNSIWPKGMHILCLQIMFADMGFLRFIVTDASTSHVVSQRIVPFSSLRPGYRHLRLRSPSNQPLELATLFIYSKTEEDLMEGRNSIDISQTAAVTGKRMSLFTKVKELSEASKEIKEVSTWVKPT